MRPSTFRASVCGNYIVMLIGDEQIRVWPTEDAQVYAEHYRRMAAAARHINPDLADLDEANAAEIERVVQVAVDNANAYQKRIARK